MTATINATAINWTVLNPVIEAAEESVFSRNLGSDKQGRWLRAISKAVAALTDNPFIALREDGALVWMNEDGQTYTVNGVCECKAAQENQPCKHIAAKRLLENYGKALAFPELGVIAPPVVGLVSFEGAQPTDAPSDHNCKLCFKPLKSRELDVHTSCALYESHADEIAEMAEQQPYKHRSNPLGETWKGYQI